MRPFTLLSLAAVALAAPLAAQDFASAPFQRGQWGVDFRIGNGFAGAGAVRFTSPTRATLLDVSGGYSHAANTAVASPPVVLRDVNVAVSVGKRGYRVLDPRVLRWTSVGVSFLYNRQSSTQGSLTQNTQGVGAGAFVNVGGAWLVTPHLGLGAQWQADLTYTHNGASAGDTKSDIVRVTLARVALTGQFYF